MKATLCLVAAITLIPDFAQAIPLAPRSSSPRTVGLDIQRRWPADILDHDRRRLLKRAGTVSETLDNLETLYFANATLGTPGQPIRLPIDTGSSDLWVN